MQITHEEARRLIQFDADETLNGIERNLLEDHLNSCLECRRYAGRIQEVESILGHMMRRRWNQQFLPHPASVTSPRKNTRLKQNMALATRIAAMSVIFIAFLFNIWQFTMSAEQRPDPSINVPPVPTPSAFSTTTKVISDECEQIIYRVQENDTLESIAIQFSVPSNEIMDVNRMKEDALQASTNLIIPICSPTPSRTVSTVTTTYTPMLGPTTSTPINNPTQ